jgi:hypothetical protein
LNFMGLLAGESSDAVDRGAWLSFIGMILLVACGLVAVVVAAWHNPVPFGHVDWRDFGSISALVLGGVTTILFISYAVYLGSLSDAGYQAGVAYVWALLTVTATAGAVIVRPAAVGRALLGGWAIGTLGYSLSQWVLLTAMSQESRGMPFLVVASLALGLAAILIRRPDRPTETQPETRGADSTA